MEANRANLFTALDSLYEEYHSGDFYLIPNSEESKVRNRIISAAKEINPSLRVDIYLCTSQMDKDVMIKL